MTREQHLLSYPRLKLPAIIFHLKDWLIPHSSLEIRESRHKSSFRFSPSLYSTLVLPTVFCNTPTDKMAITEIPIPEPRGLPFLGNIAEFNPENPLNDIQRLADTFGVYKTFLGKQRTSY